MDWTHWLALTSSAIARLAERESRRWLFTPSSAGDRHGYWVSTYALKAAAETEGAEPRAADALARYFRMAASSERENGQVGEVVEIGVGAESGPRYLFLDVAVVRLADLDDALSRALVVATSVSELDLLDSYGIRDSQDINYARSTREEGSSSRSEEPGLSPTELAVLSLLTAGATSKETAERLSIPRTEVLAALGRLIDEMPGVIWEILIPGAGRRNPNGGERG